MDIYISSAQQSIHGGVLITGLGFDYVTRVRLVTRQGMDIT
jgi:hypothetical protein